MNAMDERDAKLDDILSRVWAAALDASAILAEDDGTEEHYLQKQRHHFDLAKSEIVEMYDQQP